MGKRSAKDKSVEIRKMIEEGSLDSGVALKVIADFSDATKCPRVGNAQGVKFDQHKPDWDLLPFAEVEAVVRVLTSGAKKYAPDNWKRVPDSRSRYFAAAMRHLSAWREGEANDQETGESHLAHATCCLLFLAWVERAERKK